MKIKYTIEIERQKNARSLIGQLIKISDETDRFFNESQYGTKSQVALLWILNDVNRAQEKKIEELESQYLRQLKTQLVMLKNLDDKVQQMISRQNPVSIEKAEQLRHLNKSIQAVFHENLPSTSPVQSQFPLTASRNEARSELKRKRDEESMEPNKSPKIGSEVKRPLDEGSLAGHHHAKEPDEEKKGNKMQGSEIKQYLILFKNILTEHLFLIDFISTNADSPDKLDAIIKLHVINSLISLNEEELQKLDLTALNTILSKLKADNQNMKQLIHLIHSITHLNRASVKKEELMDDETLDQELKSMKNKYPPTFIDSCPQSSNASASHESDDQDNSWLRAFY